MELNPSWDMDKLEAIVPRDELWKFTDNFKIKPTVSDRPIWPTGKGNAFSVKSGYLLASSLRSSHEASTSVDDSELWNWVWGLEVIPKVKLFLWKCLSGSLPTAQALVSRSVELQPWCRRCGEEMESIEHAIRDCSWAAFLWEISPLRLTPVNQSDPWNVKVWVERIRSIPDKEVHNLFASLCWACWYAQNLCLSG
ncbi:uncharacterized protein LOC131026073 [Salvia miltiorrhiza]|uniref:uncharacterized protein LOC131026073 n=1 Tax=Salvia miltiorrhiza TaxID=226208 RepID=UPI0025AC5BB7|nr:uncharacterized protein LOC131026073 [Salvia miltiorrhiza]